MVVPSGESPDQRLREALRATLIEVTRQPRIVLPQRGVLRAQFTQLKSEVGHLCDAAFARFLWHVQNCSVPRTASSTKCRERCCVCDDDEERSRFVTDVALALVLEANDLVFT